MGLQILKWRFNSAPNLALPSLRDEVPLTGCFDCFPVHALLAERGKQSMQVKALLVTSFTNKVSNQVMSSQSELIGELPLLNCPINFFKFLPNLPFLTIKK